MTNKILWEAVTESGATYSFNGNGVYVDSRRRGKFYLRAQSLKNIDRDELLTRAGSSKDFWDFLNAAPQAEIPEIGKAIYIANLNEWNLSTHVVELKVFEEGESDEPDS